MEMFVSDTGHAEFSGSISVGKNANVPRLGELAHTGTNTKHKIVMKLVEKRYRVTFTTL